MSNGFDAYHKWLSIPPHDQPPNHYRLLGLGLFESDPDVVAAAADRQMAHVQTYKSGPHSELSQKLLNEIAAAKICLLRPQKKAAYDDQLRQQLGAAPAGMGGYGAGMAAPPSGSQPSGLQSSGPQSSGPLASGTPPAGIPTMAAARMSNPAPFANVGFDNSVPAGRGTMGGAVTAGAPRGMPYPGFSNSPVAPPPPTLPPPVTDAPPRPVVGTMTILVAAGVVAVLLLIGIVMVLGHRNDRPPATAIEKSDATPGAIPPAIPTQNPTSQNPAAQVSSNPGAASSFGTDPTPRPAGTTKHIGFPVTAGNDTPPKPVKPPANDDSGKKRPTLHANEVASANSTGNVPDKSHADKTNPQKTNPDKAPPVNPVKPVRDPALAGKAAVPDKAAIAAVEQRLGSSAETSTVDLLEKAHNAAEAAEIYVLLRRALDSAVKQGDAASAISTVDELARRFAVDSLEVRSQTLNDLQARVRTSESLDALAGAAAALVDEATAAARPDLAQHLEELSLTLARKSGNVETIRKITLQIIHRRTAPAPVSTSPTTGF